MLRDPLQIAFWHLVLRQRRRQSQVGNQAVHLVCDLVTLRAELLDILAAVGDGGEGCGSRGDEGQGVCERGEAVRCAVLDDVAD